MRKSVLAFGLLTAFRFTSSFSQPANHVVISEVAPMGGTSTQFNTGEYIELYNPLSVDVVFGPTVQIVSGSATLVANAAEWQVSLAGKTIKSYGFLLIGDGGVVGLDVAFPTNKNLANSGTRSCVQLREGSAVIDAFGWDPTTAPALVAEGTSFAPSGTASNKKSFERKSGPLVTTHDSQGNAWDSKNNSVDFFENAFAQANPQNFSSPIAINPYGLGPSGPGSASIVPAIWKYNQPTTMTIVFKAPVDTSRALKIVKPSIFSWNPANITFTPDSVTKAQSGDTTTLSNFFVKGTDSLVVTIPSVTSVDSTSDLNFDIRSSKDGLVFGALQAQPKTVVYGTARSMSAVKRKEANGVHSLFGKWVVVRGLITAANEFGGAGPGAVAGPSYLQDSTAGIAVFDSSVSNNVARGDEVVLLGIVAPFNDLFELAPCNLLQKISEGNPVDTLVLTAAQINGQPMTAVEPYESKLVRVNGITSINNTSGGAAATWAVTGSGTNYNLTDPTAIVQARISPRVNLANLPTPTGQFDMVGVLGQFTTTYQLLPRSYDDIIIEGQGPRIVSQAPFESNMSPTSITFSWQTDVAGTSTVRYGKTTAYGSVVADTNNMTQHQVTVTGLASATVYNVQFESANVTGTTTTANYITTTTSQNSAGTINVYFNKSVNTTVARGDTARTTDFPSKLISRINTATYSIDAALYSFSGTVGANVAQALIAAKNRGVKVRIIGEYENSNSTTQQWTTLLGGGITPIFDNYDAVNAGAGLMHNKFFVFDNRDTTSETDDWVWTGSWNLTDPGTNNDMQNSIEIQDKALANAYTLEFNEMWGSNTDIPSAASSRFGARKLDNTPHYFVIGGVPLENYFSPSDRTTNQILKTINKATYSISVAMLTLTRSDIANAMAAKKSVGLKVRAVIDNRTDQGSQFDTLLARGVDVRLDVNSAFLHHKYGIIDAETTSPNQYLITGSHNWSSSAENSNNENTLIIQSQRVANLYLQEFKARYIESGGTDNIVVSVEELSKHNPRSFLLSQNYPNPFNPSTSIDFQLPQRTNVTLSVFDVLGRQVATLLNEEKQAGTYRVTWEASTLPSGIYFCRMQTSSYSETRKMTLMK